MAATDDLTNDEQYLATAPSPFTGGQIKRTPPPIINDFCISEKPSKPLIKLLVGR
jgi:hypothetical protein